MRRFIALFSLFALAFVLVACESPTELSRAGMMPDGTTPVYNPALELREMNGFTIWKGIKFGAFTSQWMTMPAPCTSQPPSTVGAIHKVELSVTDYYTNPDPGHPFEIDIYANQHVPFHGYNTFYAYVFHKSSSGQLFYCYESLAQNGGNGPSFAWGTSNNFVTTDAGTNPASTHRWGNQVGTQSLTATLNVSDALNLQVP